MSIAPRLRSNVIAAKERLAEGREKLRQRHAKGGPGFQVCNAQSDLVDTVILDLFEAAVADLDQGGAAGLRGSVVLVPHGGYGRRDVAPFSDVDLMILHEQHAVAAVARLAERMMRDLFDAGMTLGQSVRTPRQACQLARQDVTIFTSLVESRYLAGSVHLYARFARRFQRAAKHRVGHFLKEVVDARLEERTQYGETVYLLEPNLKRSRGGLRDIQLLRWAGFIRYGTPELDGLRLLGVLSRDDHDTLRQAWEFLLRMRNDMHFHAGKANDVLDRAEQMRLSAAYGYKGTAGLLPVEQFMQEYFRMTTAVNQIVTRTVTAARRRPVWAAIAGPLFSHQFERDFRIEPTQIRANRRGVAKLQSDLGQVLRLADVANLYDKPIADATCEAIRAAVPRMPAEVTVETARRFKSLLNQPARLGTLLRTLHDLGVLEKVIPDFEHARCLLQFNEYHKYTVDEHCLRTVDEATQFQNDRGPLGVAYGQLKRKWILHLALLLHDLGKGYAEDHSEVGLAIADRVCRRLHMKEADTETVKFLVHKHLMMSHMAFRRDTSDDQLIVRLAVDVGSPEVMRMLYVLTAADLAAVGPGVLNGWKVELLTDLYHRTMHRLGDETAFMATLERLDEQRAAVLSSLADVDDTAWFEQQLEAMPASYLQSTPHEVAAEELRELRRLGPSDVVARGHYHHDRVTTEYRVATYEGVTRGLFYKLTGALSSQGLEILSAEIHTLADQLVFDRFFVHDPDFSSEPPASRIDDVCRALEKSLKSSEDKPPPFRRVWRAGEARKAVNLVPMPTQVRIDNSTSDRYTILDIFAADKTGLLYTIARTIFELDLSVTVAKIGTYLDQVVDVFYVTDQRGNKIEDEARLSEIRSRLFDVVDAFERQDAERSKEGARS